MKIESETQTADQGERNGMKGGRLICSTARHVQWRLPSPAFLATVSPDLGRWGGINRRVFLVGSVPLGSDVAASTVGAKHLHVDGHYPLATLHDGTQVTYAAQWFGDLRYSAADAEQCWQRVEHLLRFLWRTDGVSLLMTPATTGRDLWARTIPEGGWPVMGADMQQRVRSSSGQGRMETFSPPGRRPFRTLYEYDARIAYASMLADMPIGEPEVLIAPEASAWQRANPYAQARYLCTWDAPDGWNRAGILAAHSEQSERAWHWPLRCSRPQWVGGAELHVAQRHGWHVRIHGGLVWHSTGNPLGTWRDRLLRGIDTVAGWPDPFATMARNALRAILLHTIGAFHGAPHVVTRTGTAAEVPADASQVRALPFGAFTWRELQPPKWQAMVHPEWSSTVWSRARARLLYGHRGRTGLLSLDPATVVAVRTDAVYTTAPTGWETYDDRSSPGRYRLRQYGWHAAQAWPVNGTGLLQLRASAAEQVTR